MGRLTSSGFRQVGLLMVSMAFKTLILKKRDTDFCAHRARECQVLSDYTADWSLYETAYNVCNAWQSRRLRLRSTESRAILEFFMTLKSLRFHHFVHFRRLESFPLPHSLQQSSFLPSISFIPFLISLSNSILERHAFIQAFPSCR